MGVSSGAYCRAGEPTPTNPLAWRSLQVNPPITALTMLCPVYRPTTWLCPGTAPVRFARALNYEDCWAGCNEAYQAADALIRLQISKSLQQTT